MRGKTTKTPVADLEAHLGYWLRRISNHVSGAFAAELQKVHVSVAEWVVLRQMYEQANLRPAALADALGMTRGAISKVLDKLERKRWISRRVLPEDNRVQLLSLTRDGRQALPRLAEIADRNDARFFHCLSSAEQDMLRRALHKLAECHHIRNVPVE